MWKTELEQCLEYGLKELEMPLKRRIYREELLLGAGIDVQMKSGNPFDLKAKAIALQNPGDLPLFKRKSQADKGFLVEYFMRDDFDCRESVEDSIDFVIANKRFAEEGIYAYYNPDFIFSEEYEDGASILFYLGISKEDICIVDVYVEKTKKECANQGCKKFPDPLYEKFGEQLEELKQRFDRKQAKPEDIINAILDIIKAARS